MKRKDVVALRKYLILSGLAFVLLVGCSKQDNQSSHEGEAKQALRFRLHKRQHPPTKRQLRKKRRSNR